LATGPTQTYPVSGAPIYPAPVAYYPPPVATARKGPWALIFGLVSLVLLLGAGGVGALYITETDKADKSQAEQQAQIDDLRQDLEQMEGDLADAQSDLEAARECTSALEAYWLAPPGEDEDEWFDVVLVCDLPPLP
jgi:hypothetical protein